MPPQNEQDACLQKAVVPLREPVSRAGLLGMLLGAVSILRTISSPLGGAYRRDLCERITDALDRERVLGGVPGTHEFRFHRMASVRLIRHSEGVAVTDASGAVTVLDGQLVAAAYHVLHSDRGPGQILDAIEVEP